jgi:hypothetical protein
MMKKKKVYMYGGKKKPEICQRQFVGVGKFWVADLFCKKDQHLNQRPSLEDGHSLSSMGKFITCILLTTVGKVDSVIVRLCFFY